MNCEFVHKNLTDIVERNLSPETLKQVDDHLKSCGRCARVVERFSQIWQAWDHSAHIEPSADLWAKLHRRIRKMEKKRSILPIFVDWGRSLRPVAAVITMLVGMLVGYHLGNVSGGDGTGLAADQFFDYHLENFEDFPAGSVGEFYMTLGQNNEES